MGKNDFLSPKAISNRIKAKGLQKLRWYCQMCGKQCRDENGFKCHLTSESHRRQMQVFGEAPTRVIEGYSERFQSDFMTHLRQAHPSSRVSAKVVYNEFITDKHHIHMNATKWFTLTEFVAHLGRAGLCKVDKTEKGWFIKYIKRDTEEEINAERRRKRVRAEKEEDDRLQDAINAQIERAREGIEVDEAELQRVTYDEEDYRLDLDAKREGLKLSVAAARPLGASGLGPAEQAPPSAPEARSGAKRPRSGFEDGEAQEEARQPQRPLSKMEQIMLREQDAKRAQQAQQRSRLSRASGPEPPGRKDEPWLREGLVVKVVSRELEEHGYFKKKGAVLKLASRFVGELEMLDSGDVLRVDQAQLETVLPAAGGAVAVVGGPLRGCAAVMVGLDAASFQAEVELGEGPQRGERVHLVYEHVCKLAGK